LTQQEPYFSGKYRPEREALEHGQDLPHPFIGRSGEAGNFQELAPAVGFALGHASRSAVSSSHAICAPISTRMIRQC
jgi:hypothetical protein